MNYPLEALFLKLPSAIASFRISYDVAYQLSLGLNNSGTFFGTRTAWYILA